MGHKERILVVEDETSITNFISTILAANNFDVLSAQNGSQALMLASSHCPDAIILDLGLPDIDGQRVIQSIREWSEVPILVVSARMHERDKVAALDLGANDYITKPFGTAELLARLRAALRSNRVGAEISAVPGGKFVLKDLEIHYDTRTVTVSGKPIELTQTEYNIVTCLSTHAGKVLTYAAIIQAVWGYSDHGSIKKLQVNMANIRKKLGAKPGANRYIINELGVGYRMQEGNS